MYWNLIVLVLCFLMTAFLLWKEYKRPEKAWLFVRIITSVLTVASLACLAFSFTVSTKESVNATDVILLTEGYNSDSVQQVMRKYQVDKTYTGDKALSAFNAEYIPDLAAFKQQG